jgi:prefoldin subunit 5
MSADLDWTRLETLVSRAAERLRQAAADNQRLRAEVARLEAELDLVRAATGEGGLPADFEARVRELSPRNSEHTEEVRRRLAQLENEIESLLAGSAG